MHSVGLFKTFDFITFELKLDILFLQGCISFRHHIFSIERKYLVYIDVLLKSFPADEFFLTAFAYILAHSYTFTPT